MGRALAWLEARSPRGETARLLYGAGVALGGPLAWGGLAVLLERATPTWLHAALLKPTFAGRALLEAGARVEAALQAGRLEEAHQQLRALVSRPTHDLDAGLASAAAIESLAENFADSWVAPLLAYALFGLAGAYAYRAANTADAMWGYRTVRYERLGKAAARLDDLLSWLPARLAATLLLLAAGAPRSALAAWRRDAARTASPNAGQTMAVAAGALGVRLEKTGHYVLNSAGRTPVPADVARARGMVRTAMLLAAVLALLLRGRGPGWARA